ncbi:PREDICTED: uncharacterized protein LOC102852131 [Elephantulus edwardii]|uniref:uncharacterized protein LOC102852131 n=1 Tax=Elephantulus edwardii TaxID=28737 RepID=UPI0003F09EEB|nr:PREDICTED: uncharacterized protein LOC102852131 [Elephantulus edwardii]
MGQKSKIKPTNLEPHLPKEKPTRQLWSLDPNTEVQADPHDPGKRASRASSEDLTPVLQPLIPPHNQAKGQVQTPPPPSHALEGGCALALVQAEGVGTRHPAGDPQAADPGPSLALARSLPEGGDHTFWGARRPHLPVRCRQRLVPALPEIQRPLARGTMLSSGGSYAGRKRKKPVRKSPKPQPPEGVKSNPSKRHRERLNQELSKLTTLLPFPEDVQARLDKLSILRLIVGYLKVKGYFSGKSPDSGVAVGLQPGTLGASEHASPQLNAELFSEGDLLLQALNGFLMAVTEDGYVFYVSPTVQDYLGFHQSDVIYQSVFELIHKEDRPMFKSQLCWSPDPDPVTKEAKQNTSQKSLPHIRSSGDDQQYLPSENSTSLERSFVCRFRCLLDNSSGFLELNFHGHLKSLPGPNNRSEDGILVSPQLTLFAIATPHQPLTILELQTKTYLFQTKHKLDFTPIACDSRGQDKTYKVIRTAQPDCIVARQRALTNAEGEEHLQKRAGQLPFTFTTGEAILYESNLPGLLNPIPTTRKRSRAKKGPPAGQAPVHPGSLLGAMMRQDESMYSACTAPTPQGSPLSRWASDNGCDSKEDEEGEEGRPLLTFIETLLEKDTEEQPDLCFTLQQTEVTDLTQENFLRTDSDTSGPQNCHLLPPRQREELQREVGAFSHDETCVSLPLLASTTPLLALRPRSSQGLDDGARELTLPQNLGAVPSQSQVHLQHFLIPGHALLGPLQSSPQEQAPHSQAAPSDFRMSQKQRISDHNDVTSPLPETSSPRRPAQRFQPACTAALSLGENVLGHLDQADPGVLDFCEETVPQTPTHSRCQEPLMAPDPAFGTSPCGSHLSGSIWDFSLHSQPVDPVEQLPKHNPQLWPSRVPAAVPGRTRGPSSHCSGQTLGTIQPEPAFLP